MASAAAALPAFGDVRHRRLSPDSSRHDVLERKPVGTRWSRSNGKVGCVTFWIGLMMHIRYEGVTKSTTGPRCLASDADSEAGEQRCNGGGSDKGGRRRGGAFTDQTRVGLAPKGGLGRQMERLGLELPQLPGEELDQAERARANSTAGLEPRFN